MRKKVWWMIAALAFVLVVLIGLGVMFNQKENEKAQGFLGIYDVASTGMLAYIVYTNGQAGIYLQGAEKVYDNPVFQLPVEQEILDVDFSGDGSSLAFVVANKEGKENLGSIVYAFDIASLKGKELFSDEGLVTEVAFDPKEEEALFYLRAATFENYSPIASARPHDFDLFSYQISDNEHVQVTQLEKYSMDSLKISTTDEIAYLQMFDDEAVETAEELFDAKQKVFEIPLSHPSAYEVISEEDWPVDIYDFAIMPSQQEMVFQSVAGEGGDGLYEYELFSYDWKTGEEAQLTRMKKYAGRPIIDSTHEKIYYLVDHQFGKRIPSYSLYKMDLDGGNKEEVDLAL